MDVLFNDAITSDDDAVRDAFDVEAWNYEWTRNYGSLQYDIRTGKAGTTMMNVEDVRVSPDRRSVWLEIPDMTTAMQLQVDWSLDFESAGARESFVHLSVHQLADVSGRLLLD